MNTTLVSISSSLQPIFLGVVFHLVYGPSIFQLKMIQTTEATKNTDPETPILMDWIAVNSEVASAVDKFTAAEIAIPLTKDGNPGFSFAI
ncbi:MAG: hypothetical protein KAX65_02110 [Caldilineaceae bacterium]|nr:hypothetical protein [Caldilineaceae bacterium]